MTLRKVSHLQPGMTIKVGVMEHNEGTHFYTVGQVCNVGSTDPYSERITIRFFDVNTKLEYGVNFFLDDLIEVLV